MVFFTSLPSYNLREGSRKPGLKGQRKKGIMRMAAEGALNLLKVCEEICGAQGKLHWNYSKSFRLNLFIFKNSGPWCMESKNS